MEYISILGLQTYKGPITFQHNQLTLPHNNKFYLGPDNLGGSETYKAQRV